MTYATNSIDCDRCPHPLEVHTAPGGCQGCGCVVRYSTIEVQTLRRNIGLPAMFNRNDY